MGLVAVAGSTTDRRSRLVETNVLNDGDSQLSSSFFSPPLRIDRSSLDFVIISRLDNSALTGLQLN